MRLHFVVHAAFITLALGIPSIIPRIADNTVNDPPDTDHDIIQPAPTAIEVADSDTISMPKFHLCYDQYHKHVPFWTVCGYRDEDNRSFICNGWMWTCKLGYLKTGEDGKDEVCENDSNCTENWLEPLKSSN